MPGGAGGAAPALVSTSPPNNSTNASANLSTVILTFDSLVEVGGGDIVYVIDSTSSTANLDVNTTTQVIAVGKSVYVNISQPGDTKGVRVIIPSSAIYSVAGNAYAGDTISFITEGK